PSQKTILRSPAFSVTVDPPPQRTVTLWPPVAACTTMYRCPLAGKIKWMDAVRTPISRRHMNGSTVDGDGVMSAPPETSMIDCCVSAPSRMSAAELIAGILLLCEGETCEMERPGVLTMRPS